MSLVTEQGRAAQARKDKRIRVLAGKVSVFLTETTDYRDLYRAFPDEDRDDLKEAMWKLIDADLIYITHDRKLAPTGRTA